MKGPAKLGVAQPNSRWCVSDPLPPSAALPLTEGENKALTLPVLISLVRGRRERSERGVAHPPSGIRFFCRSTAEKVQNPPCLIFPSTRCSFRTPLQNISRARRTHERLRSTNLLDHRDRYARADRDDARRVTGFRAKRLPGEAVSH